MSDLNEQALKLLQDLESRHQHVLDELDSLNERVDTVLKNYARDEELRLGVSQDETDTQSQTTAHDTDSIESETQKSEAKQSAESQEERKAA